MRKGDLGRVFRGLAADRFRDLRREAGLALDFPIIPFEAPATRLERATNSVKILAKDNTTPEDDRLLAEAFGRWSHAACGAKGYGHVHHCLSCGADITRADGTVEGQS